MATESQIATPPSIAVGFLCQRSVFGTATKPKRRATARTSGVSISAKQKEAATARRVRGLKDMSGKTMPQKGTKSTKWLFQREPAHFNLYVPFVPLCGYLFCL